MRIYFGHKLDTSFFKIKIIIISPQRVRKTSGKEITLIIRKKINLKRWKRWNCFTKAIWYVSSSEAERNVKQYHEGHSGTLMSQWFFFRVCFDHSGDRENSMRVEILGSTENPLLSPPWGLFISNTFEGVLNKDGGLIWERPGAYLIYKVEKLKYKKLKAIAAEDQKINKPRVGKYTIPDQSTRSFNY